jgi:hypothetical protein
MVISATTGAHVYHCARAATLLRQDMLVPDQQLLPRAASAEATAALRLWRWDSDGVARTASPSRSPFR